jgi:hypothetical protein
MKASEITDKASKLVSGDRNETHGDVTENHANIARLWSGYLEHGVSPQDVAMMMVLLKVARTKLGAFNEDDFVDAAGYAGVAGEIAARDADMKANKPVVVRPKTGVALYPDDRHKAGY